MGLMDNLGDKAKDFADQNPDKLNEASEKGGDFLDDRTGGKYADQVDKGQEFAQERFGGGNADQSDQSDQQQ